MERNQNKQNIFKICFIRTNNARFQLKTDKEMIGVHEESHNTLWVREETHEQQQCIRQEGHPLCLYFERRLRQKRKKI